MRPVDFPTTALATLPIFAMFVAVAVSADERRGVDESILIELLVDDNTTISLPYSMGFLASIQCPTGFRCDVCLNVDETLSFWEHRLEYVQRVSAMLPSMKTMKRARDQKDCWQTATRNSYRYYLMINSFSLYVNPKLIETLISKQKIIAVGMMTTVGFSSMNYNFQMTPMMRSLESAVHKRERLGCFPTNAFSYPVLTDLERLSQTGVYSMDSADELQDGFDDFFLSYTSLGFEAYVCNRDFYGHIPRDIKLLDATCVDSMSFRHMILEFQISGPNKTYLDAPPRFHESLFETDNCDSELTFDKIYVINLKRRKDRLERIEKALEILNMRFQIVEAFDGTVLTLDDLDRMQVKMLTEYIDPYNRRPINIGEIACSLSHAWIWQDAYEKQYQSILILEDDARFDVVFKQILNTTMDKIETTRLQWDMIYLGRKILESNEKYIDVVSGLVRPLYSHWTVAYALSSDGIKKLVNGDLLRNMIPVDEYLPIMYGRTTLPHLNSFFPHGSLRAFAFHPSIVQPTHYFGEPNYVSDTENTTVVMGTPVIVNNAELEGLSTNTRTGRGEEL